MACFEFQLLVELPNISESLHEVLADEGHCTVRWGNGKSEGAAASFAWKANGSRAATAAVSVAVVAARAAATVVAVLQIVQALVDERRIKNRETIHSVPTVSMSIISKRVQLKVNAINININKTEVGREGWREEERKRGREEERKRGNAPNE